VLFITQLNTVTHFQFFHDIRPSFVNLTDLPHVRKTPHLWGEPEDVVMEGEDAFTVVEGDSFTLKCASSVYNNTQHPVWYTNRGTAHNSTGQASAKL
jgi:hypothetical protein